jgi:hypothetical protein
MTIKEYNERYEEILHSSDLNSKEKTMELADLMTDMEYEFKIPMLRNEEWEKDNKKVIALYRKISMSRDL